MLERLRLRNDVVARLLAANTDAGENVSKDRIDDMPEGDCPAICVYTLDESGDNVSESRAPIFKSEITLQIDVAVAATEGWGVKLDAICEQIETALLHSPAFLAEFERVASYNTRITQRPGGEVAVAIASIQLGLVYSNAFWPVVPDHFATAGVQIDAINPHDANIAETGPDGVIEAELELELE
ncbi:hypothetical protein [Sneathiella sp.]|uniref:hypothetical protein n=1 Tax=Sneathiella sp. TaxID=1964365 RepID=UPI002FE35882